LKPIEQIIFLLQLLGVSQFIEAEKNRSFILSTQQDYTGGFSKWSDTIADPLHTYFGKAIQTI
jgi:geranylgeranyl transferase type-1 subunit beta